MQKFLTIFFLTIASSYFCSGQGLENSRTFGERLSVRKTYQSLHSRDDPAILTFTIPEEAPNSWLVQAGIAYDLVDNLESTLQIRPFAEVHRNSLVAREQFNYQAGVNIEFQNQVDIYDPKDKLYHNFTGNLRFNENRIRRTSSIVSNFYYSPTFRFIQGSPFQFKPGDFISIGNIIELNYLIYAGLEMDNRIQVLETNQEGSIIRGMGRVNAQFLLFPALLRERIRLDMDYQLRRQFFITVEENLSINPYIFSGSFNYVILEGSKFSPSLLLGLDYTRGEDPNNNFERQAFWALSLKFTL